MKNKTRPEIERAARSFIERSVAYRAARPELDTFYFTGWYAEDRQKVLERAKALANELITHL